MTLFVLSSTVEGAKNNTSKPENGKQKTIEELIKEIELLSPEIKVPDEPGDRQNLLAPPLPSQIIPPDPAAPAGTLDQQVDWITFSLQQMDKQLTALMNQQFVRQPLELNALTNVIAEQGMLQRQELMRIRDQINALKAAHQG